MQSQPQQPATTAAPRLTASADHLNALLSSAARSTVANQAQMRASAATTAPAPANTTAVSTPASSVPPTSVAPPPVAVTAPSPAQLEALMPEVSAGRYDEVFSKVLHQQNLGLLHGLCSMVSPAHVFWEAAPQPLRPSTKLSLLQQLGLTLSASQLNPQVSLDYIDLLLRTLDGTVPRTKEIAIAVGRALRNMGQLMPAEAKQRRDSALAEVLRLIQ